MHTCYDDILSRVTSDPKWFDEHAVPRYCDFSPDECADIYARQACLLLIECQNCARPFEVALSWSDYSPKNALDGLVRRQEIHFGDPPNVECCSSGPSMNSVPKRVLQFWRRNPPPRDLEVAWIRDATLEIEINPSWMKNRTSGVDGDRDGEGDDS